MGMNPAGSVQASARLTINQPSEFRETNLDKTFLSNVYIFFSYYFLINKYFLFYLHLFYVHF